MSERYDVIIVGGGMVGLTLACALADTPLRVALIEATAIETDIAPGQAGLRVSAITHASRNIFAAVGAWDGICARGVSAFAHMHVWDASGNGVIHFDGDEIGAATLGYIIENAVVQAGLLARLKQAGNVDVICPARWQTVRTLRDATALVLDDGRVLEAVLLVAADGARSPLREQAGIAVHGWGYDQCGVVATVSTERHHGETAWQRFLPTGPLAFLPLADGRCSIVWSTTPAQASELLQLDEAEFCRRLGNAFDHALGAVTGCGPRAMFPLKLQHAQEYVRPRLALIGDAAHQIHPLAGQGANIGMLDAAALAEVVLEARRKGRDIGDYGVLRRYERWRKGHNIAVMAAMDGFKRVFGSSVLPLRWVRNIGLSVANATPPIKRLCMELAMGERGDLPPLARARLDAAGWALGFADSLENRS